MSGVPEIACSETDRRSIRSVKEVQSVPQLRWWNRERKGERPHVLGSEDGPSTSNKKQEQRASLLVARTLLVASGITSNKKLLGAM